VNFDGYIPREISKLEAFAPAVSPDGQWPARVALEGWPKLVLLNGGSGAIEKYVLPLEPRTAPT
jgi:hypothetical protein